MFRSRHLCQTLIRILHLLGHSYQPRRGTEGPMRAGPKVWIKMMSKKRALWFHKTISNRNRQIWKHQGPLSRGKKCAGARETAQQLRALVILPEGLDAFPKHPRGISQPSVTQVLEEQTALSGLPGHSMHGTHRIHTVGETDRRQNKTNLNRRRGKRRRDLEESKPRDEQRMS